VFFLKQKYILANKRCTNVSYRFLRFTGGILR